MTSVRRFARIGFWEFAQNLPLISAFSFGHAYLRAGSLPLAASAVIAGAAGGALLIRCTEPLIQAGPRERWAETRTNFLFFSTAIALFIAYFHWGAGSWPIDILLGIAAGITAGALQARAAGARPQPAQPSLHNTAGAHPQPTRPARLQAAHAAALSASFSVALLVIRFAGLRMAPLPAAALIDVPVTTIIVWLEYRPAAALTRSGRTGPRAGSTPPGSPIE